MSPSLFLGEAPLLLALLCLLVFSLVLFFFLVKEPVAFFGAFGAFCVVVVDESSTALLFVPFSLYSLESTSMALGQEELWKIITSNCKWQSIKGSINCPERERRPHRRGGGCNRQSKKILLKKKGLGSATLIIIISILVISGSLYICSKKSFNFLKTCFSQQLIKGPCQVFNKT